jgi:hypothetical protein
MRLQLVDIQVTVTFVECVLRNKAYGERRVSEHNAACELEFFTLKFL